MNSCRFFHVLVAGLLGSLCIPTARAATFDVTGTTLAINLTAASEAVAITAGAANYSFALTGGTWSGTDSADATGNGTTSLSAVKASFTAVTVDDASTGNAVNFNDSGANTYSSNFTIKMDGASPGVSNFAGATPFAGNAALFVQAGSVNCNPGTVISAVGGNLTILGNMQTPGLTGNVFGIFMNDTQIRVTGSGNLTLKGTCGISTSTVSGVRLNGASTVTGGTVGSTLTIEGYGAASSTRNHGVNLSGTSSIATLGGDVVVTGVAGTSSTGDNKGVLMEVGTSILATGSGSITMTGTGGGTAGTVNTGIEMLSGTQIASVNGNVSVTGTGGGGTTGSTNRGVFVAGTIKSTGSGNVSVTGTGGPGSGGDNQGVLMERNGTGTVQEIKSGTGDVTVTGTAGGGPGSLGIKVNSVAAAAASISTGTPGGISLITDSINLVTSAVISAPSVTVAPKTPGMNIDLGSSSDTIANTLALSQAELNTITANTLNVGDLNTAVIDFSANLTRPAGSTTNLIAAVINFNGFGITGGTVRQTVAGQPDISVVPSPGVFGSVAQGSTRDLVFTLSNVGFVDLTGISIAGLSSTDFSVVASPAASVPAGGSTSFTIRFAPTIPGTSLATLQITSSDPDENPAIIQLTGFAPSSSPLSGTKSVGPTGYYTSLTQAITDIQAATLGGALVLELQPTYVSTVETFPLTIPALNGASAVNTLTIRPAAGSTALSITGAAAQTVDLNGAQFVTLDGRPGGTGTAKELTIANTSTSGVALRFINEASGNTLKFVTLRGVNTGANSGTVVFSTTTGAFGNDNNTLDTCDIRDGSSTPANGVFSAGSTGTPAQNNSGNTVSNSNIFNFYSSTAASSGVLLAGGNTDWTISGNSFFQTATRTAVAQTVNPIFINNTTGNNFTVTGNYIGGDSPGAAVTAQKWTTTGTSAAYLFQGIRLNVGITAASSVQGNTIANIVWTSSSTANTLPGVWSGIYVAAGNVNIGTLTGNTIGSGTGTGSISVSNGSVGNNFGIGSASSGTVAIDNNTIGSITTVGVSASAAWITGISVTAGANTISNNLVGSTTTANSINAPNTSSSGQQVTGIISTSSGGASITGNTVANLNNASPSSLSSLVRGIITTAGVNTITGNTVRNLSTVSGNTNTTVAATNGPSVLGVADISTTAGQTVSQNTVHSLANTAASAAVGVTGIYFANPTSGTNVIARNFVHSLDVLSSSSSSQLRGMEFVAGTFTAQNNMVRVGLKADGTSTAGTSIIRGIFDNGPTAGRNFYHNSVFVGGTQTSGAGNTVAFQSTGVSNARTYQNNIFVNARSNSGATSKHYAVQYGGTTVNPAGLTAGGNLFYAPNTASGGVLGSYNGTDLTTLAAWQGATGQDATSAVSDPLFVAPTGDASTVDLHLQASNPAERGGIQLTDALAGATVTVTDDFDGQTRSTLTPVDVGADAGSFTVTPRDLFAPGIRYPLLTSGSTDNRVLTGWASIVDNASGGVSGGASAPRLYYKKSTDADVFGVANDSTGNGWKYVSGTDAGGGSYSFTLDYSLINGGSVSIGDTVQYFVVAQDAANNLVSSPAAAVASANPPVQNINAKPAAGVNSFSIVSPISGTKTVGTGGDYPSLSGAGGLFAALNAGVLNGNVTVNITSDTTETGAVTLSQFAMRDYPAAYTLTIQPDSATMRTISGTAANGLITLNGADRVTIDGRFGSIGRYLTFRNTSTGASASTILFQNDASNNTVRNCVVEGASASTTLGVIGFSTGAVTGNDNNLITDNQVRDLSTVAGLPTALIGSTGSSTNVSNSGNTVSNNELFNFFTYGVFISTGNDSWTISGNTIYQAAARTGAMNGISLSGSGVITGNTIRDLNTSQYAAGIYLNNGTSVTVASNRIYSLPSASGSNALLQGIYNAGFANVTVVNNQISIIPSFTNNQSIEGIRDDFGSAGTFNAYYNSVVIGGTGSGTANTWAVTRRGSTAFTARNNLFLNLRTGGTGNHFAAGREGTGGGSYTAGSNVYAGTGATAASFMDFSTTASPVPVSFAAWQSSTGDTSTSASNPGGNYSSALFVNAAAGDLHLVSGGNVLANNAGTPIAGITTDYDGDKRSATTPTIGADEFPFTDIAVTQTQALTDNVSGVEFGTVTLGSSTAKTFTITNAGNTDLTNLDITKDGTDAGDFTVSALSGTSIPAGSGSVTFTVTFTPGASGSKSAAIHIASNVSGAKNPFDISLSGVGNNTPPAFSGYTLSAKKNTAATIGLAKLLARAADSDGGTPAISAVSAASSQGGSVSLTATSVVYAPANDFTGLDTFTLTIIDGQGASVTGTVTVSVTDATAASGNQASQIVLQPGGEVSVQFFGIPGQSYQIQRSTDLTTWTFLQNATAAADGSISFTDPSPPPGAGFYRTVVP